MHFLLGRRKKKEICTFYLLAWHQQFNANILKVITKLLSNNNLIKRLIFASEKEYVVDSKNAFMSFTIINIVQYRTFTVRHRNRCYATYQSSKMTFHILKRKVAEHDKIELNLSRNLFREMLIYVP